MQYQTIALCLVIMGCGGYSEPGAVLHPGMADSGSQDTVGSPSSFYTAESMAGESSAEQSTAAKYQGHHADSDGHEESSSDPVDCESAPDGHYCLCEDSSLCTLGQCEQGVCVPIKSKSCVGKAEGASCAHNCVCNDGYCEFAYPGAASSFTTIECVEMSEAGTASD